MILLRELTLVGRYNGIMSESMAVDEDDTPLILPAIPLPMGESICIGVEDIFGICFSDLESSSRRDLMLKRYRASTR